MTLGRKVKIGKTEKIIGAKDDEQIEEMRARGIEILNTPLTIDDEEITLSEVKSGEILYQILDEFQDELVNLGVDYTYIQCMWFAWREMRMAEMLGGFEAPIQEAIKLESKNIEEHFFDEKEDDEE